jgi:hypothetical protein
MTWNIQIRVMNRKNKKPRAGSRYGHFVEEAKHLFNQSLSWSVQHVRREANNVAHQLAQKAALRDEENIWLSNFPDFIRNLVFSDQEVFV